jgi:hypothetical protein
MPPSLMASTPISVVGQGQETVAPQLLGTQGAVQCTGVVVEHQALTSARITPTSKVGLVVHQIR